ncbi:MAG: type II secretion system inner membrane protein GspF [Myxococcales bacterium]|nr:type II secretion system inner membrane protein GspF [Myxococcales bacterium]
MAVFEYTGKSAGGKTVKGVLDVDNVRALKAALRRDKIFLTEYKQTSAKGGKRGAKVKGGKAQSAGSADVDFQELLTRISPMDIAEMTRQLATLQKAGVPLVDGMTAIVEQTENPKLKRVLSEVRTDLNEGTAFSRALAKHPKVFDQTYSNMVRAGESSGNLDIVLQRLADFTESQVRLQNKIIGALTYPVIMLIISLFIVAAMMVLVVPKITIMFEDLGADLPFITKMLIFFSDLLSNWWPLLILLGVGAFTLFDRWRRSEDGSVKWDRFLLKVPVLGDLVRKIAIARFARTLATLLSSGVPLLSAMEIVETVVSNKVLAAVLAEARVAIREGDTISGPLKRSEEFPPMVTHMVAIGERSGELENMLKNVSESYENQVDTRVNALTSILEPIMIVGMGIMVAFLVAAILLPMMQLTSAVSG